MNHYKIKRYIDNSRAIITLQWAILYFVNAGVLFPSNYGETRHSGCVLHITCARGVFNIHHHIRDEIHHS